jgi:ABC-type Zn uptake system ZnuABC Zn-binding protein ZnuA
MTKKTTLCFSNLLLVLICACTPIQVDESEEITVLATTSIVADVLQNIAGQHIEVTALLPNGSDPHGYSATPQDLVKITSADLVFISGLGLEESLNDFLIGNVDSSSIVTLSDRIQLAGNNDPHVWMNPQNVIAWVEKINFELIQLDPTHASEYQANTHNYIAQLTELDDWALAQLSSIDISSRMLLSDHENLTHLADRYDLEIVGTLIAGVSSLSEPSAQDLSSLENKVHQLGLSAIFVGSPESEALAAQFALDAGIAVVHLFVESLSEAQGPAPTYLEMMRYDVNLIAETLK